MIDIIIFEIGNEGNLGAISRVMANFDFKSLILINPKIETNSIETIKRAKHSEDVLKNLRVTDESILNEYDYLIATTAKLGNDYNIPRSPVSPEALKEQLKDVDVNQSKIALLIGREGDGLTNEEIKRSDFLISIPASKEYPTLNISHAVGIILYELFKINQNSHIDHIIPAKKEDKDVLLKIIDDKLENMEFDTPEKKETQKMVWKKLHGKSIMTKRELFALIGFFKKL